MIWTIEFNWSLGVVKVIYEGKSSIDDSLRAKKEYLSSPHWQPGLNILVDFRRAILIYPGIDELRRTVAFQADRPEEYGVNRIAYLVKNKRDYGIARQITALLEFHTLSESAVFLKYEEAIKWLTDNVPNERSQLIK